jgi:hypothetical protein
MADDYGKTVDEMRAILLQVNLLAKAGSFAPQPAASDNEDPPLRRSAAPMPSRNGTNGKVTV